ncbi:MAG: prolyl oligopeptidase family serine peptidase [Clostridia bacterium]|nr:prolyl oligopeptidase family serine peptidase [Clostridia bacterium]
MKKIIAVVLCVLMMVLCFSAGVSALSLNDGNAALDAAFLDGEYERGFDYVYFSPKKGDDDTVKYPLTVWLHGMKSGTEKRAQLKYYEFSNWASDEYQARFADAGGCYLLAVRASDSDINSWTVESCGKLKATIDYFIARNRDNIDPTRIYIAGYSTGGSAVWDMLASYPGFFAAAVPAAAVFQPSSEEVAQIGKTAVWIFSSDNDPYPMADSNDALLTFNRMKTVVGDGEKVRFSRFTDARFADGSKRYNLDTGEIMWDAEHFIWESITYDMHMADRKTPYINCITVDGNGNTPSFESRTEGVISWLSRQKLHEDDIGASTWSFITWIRLVFQRIADFFSHLFGRY